MKKSGLLIPFIILLMLISCINEKEQVTNVTPVFKVSTDSVLADYSNISATSIEVIVYGTTDQEHSCILDRGVCYSEKPNPTTADDKSNSYEWNVSTPYLLKIHISSLKANKVYHFRYFVVTNLGLQYGNDLTYSTTTLPVLINSSLTYVSKNKVGYRFWLISNGGFPLLSAGIVWSKSKNPTIDLSTKTNIVLGDNHDYSGVAFDLEPATTYYAKCYATNKNGVMYSKELTINTLGGVQSDPVTDIDGNIYKTIKIGDQIWMIDNLRTTKYRNGDEIGTTSPATKDISLENEPKYQWAFDGIESNTYKYGRLYTWYATKDDRNIAPDGWHVPSAEEFKNLKKYLVENGYNSPNFTGVYLDYLGKAIASKTLWNVNQVVGNIGCDLSANNSSDYNALPVGIRNSASQFDDFGYSTLFWSTTEYNSSDGLGRQLCADYPDFYSYYAPKYLGCSIRCIKDSSSKVRQASR